MNSYSHILWDFNGTLLDDVHAGIESENVLLRRRGMPLIRDVEHYHSLFGFPIIEYYKRLGHDFERESYDDMADEWVEQYIKYSADCPLCPGALEMLDAARGTGIPQLILSATEINMLRSQLAKLGIGGYFCELLALDNVKAYGKTQIALEWKERVRPERPVLIGDTTHDFETSRAIGADCLLVCTGHQSRATLERCGVPVYTDLLEILHKLNRA